MQTLISPYRKNNGHAQIIHKIWFSSSLKSSDVSIFFSYFMTNTVLFTNLNIVPVDHKDHKYTFKIFTECYHKVQPAKYFIYKVPGRHYTLGKMHLFHNTSFTTCHRIFQTKTKTYRRCGISSMKWCYFNYNCRKRGSEKSTERSGRQKGWTVILRQVYKTWSSWNWMICLKPWYC